jgi:hypothetical protein
MKTSETALVSFFHIDEVIAAYVCSLIRYIGLFAFSTFAKAVARLLREYDIVIRGSQF